MIICKCGRKLKNDRAICFCEHNGNIVQVNIPTETIKDNLNFNTIKDNNKNTYVDKTLELQRQLWQELHTYRFISPELTREWFENWKIRIPCGNCKRNFDLLLQEFFPDFLSAENFFNWSVKIHNKVNKKLGKREFSTQEAKELWKNA